MTRLPGTRLLAIARRWLDPRTVTNVFEPLVADWQHQWLAATTPRERMKVRASGFVAALSAVAQIAPAWILTPPPGGLARPLAIRTLSFCAVASALLMYPFAVSYWRIASWETWVYLVPAAVVIPLSYVALPLAYWLRQFSDENDHRARRMLVQSIATLCVASALMVSWVVPSANQQWRRVTYASINGNSNPRPPVNGVRELTIPQLLSEASNGPRFRSAQREIHKRAALAFSPLTLGAIGWVFWQRRRRGTVSVFLSWVVGGASFYQLSVFGRGIEDAYALPAGPGFWLAHLLALFGLMLYSRTRHEAPGTDPLAP